MIRRLHMRGGVPVVLELEDLHWADDESLDFLSYLFEVNRDVPMLVLAASRGTLFERRPDCNRTEGAHSRIDLSPLDKTGSRLMADELPRKLPEVPPALRERVTAGAEGNPFYMEELVRMLIDQGAARTGGPASGRWTLDAERLSATRVPATLTGVLQARLDGLPADERLTLQQASVIGPVFWDHALIALDDNAQRSLPALVRRELTVPSKRSPDASHDDACEYAFKNQLLRQVTYGTVLKRTRRELHHRLAQWLASQTGLRAKAFLGATADHFEQAGDDIDAAEFHARAAEHACTCLAHDAVLRHVGRGLALIDRTPAVESRQLRWRLLDARERTLEVRGERAAQEADIAAMEALSAALGDPQRQAHAAYRRSVMAQRTGDWPACEQAGRRAMDLAERAGDHRLRLLAMRLAGRAMVRPGDKGAGKAMVHAALAEARGRGLRAVESFCLNSLLVVASIECDPVAVLGLAREALVINREIGNRLGEAISLSAVGFGLLDLGEHTLAGQELEASLRLQRANGDRLGEAATLSGLSTVALRQDDDARALAMARAAVDVAEQVKARHIEAIALCKLGSAELALGRHAQAAAAYARSGALAAPIGEAVRHDATAGLARVSMAEGKLGDARAWVDELLGQLSADDSLDGVEDPRLIEWTCHEVLAAAGDARADEWLGRAHAHLQRQASTISDPSMRRGFLSRIPAHRRIVAAFEER